MPSAERVPAYAKLTRTLRVVGVRPDGYHLIDAEMVRLELCDWLMFSEGEHTLPPADLVTKALAAVGERGRTIRVDVDKRIPLGAGLGGGSADAAAVLAWAGCTDVDLAIQLGADVPFCLLGGGRARVTGVGEQVEPLAFEDRAFTLLTPPLHVSTAAVYQRWDDLGGPTDPAGVNDLTLAALDLVPDLARYRDALGDATSETPVLAGSGGTWFVDGEFPEVPHIRVTRTSRP